LISHTPAKPLWRYEKPARCAIALAKSQRFSPDANSKMLAMDCLLSAPPWVRFRSFECVNATERF
jgi:hypothetical protein